MAVDERRRRQLREQLTAAVGAEATETMFALLPPEGEEPATHRQVVELSSRMDRGFEHVDGRIDRVEARLDGIDHRLDRMDDRMTGWEHQLESQTDRLTAVFRQELLVAVTGQTRAILLAVFTTLVGTASLAVAFAQLTG